MATPHFREASLVTCLEAVLLVSDPSVNWVTSKSLTVRDPILDSDKIRYGTIYVAVLLPFFCEVFFFALKFPRDP